VLPDPPRDEGAEKFHGDAAVGPGLMVWTMIKNRSSVKDDVPERL